MTDWSELARESESRLSSLAKGQSVRCGSVRTGHGDLRRAAIDMRTCGRKRPVTRWFCTGPRGVRGGIPGRIAGRMASLQLPAQWKCYSKTLELCSFVFRGKKEAPSSGPWPRPTTQRIPSLVPFLNFQDFDDARDRVESAKKKGSKSQSFENPPKAPNLEIWLPQLGGE